MQSLVTNLADSTKNWELITVNNYKYTDLIFANKTWKLLSYKFISWILAYIYSRYKKHTIYVLVKELIMLLK